MLAGVMSIKAMKQVLNALEDISRQPEGDEQSAQAVAREALIDLRAAIAEAEKQKPVAWLGLEPSDMPDGDDPMYDHDFFIKGMVWADSMLCKKNAIPPAAQQDLVLAEREAVCRIVTGLCISDNNAEEINRAIRARGQT
jgi:hypothetical protein